MHRHLLISRHRLLSLTISRLGLKRRNGINLSGIKRPILSRTTPKFPLPLLHLLLRLAKLMIRLRLQR